MDNHPPPKITTDLQKRAGTGALYDITEGLYPFCKVEQAQEVTDLSQIQVVVGEHWGNLFLIEYRTFKLKQQKNYSALYNSPKQYRARKPILSSSFGLIVQQITGPHPQTYTASRKRR